VSSFDSPLIVERTSIISGLTLSSQDPETGTVTISVNGGVVTTISLAATEKSRVSGLSIALSADDEISAQVTVGSIKKPLLAIWMKAS
jgi:hypothetical protein